ncbi:TorF family putative porin [Variovorax sp. GT1P44]|uniref:TorF family putative porin n=1 Tax=Variovorax sp. GT1P44 TaxID=3443742 RepID=UPI003F481F2F
MPVPNFRSHFIRTATVMLLLAATGAVAQTSDKAEEATPADAGPWTVTRHIDLTYPYVLRGATTTYGNGVPLGNAGADAPESSRVALQGGFDVLHASGWSFGYFASTINYSYKQLGRSYDNRAITDFQRDKSIENDLYGAFSGNLVGDLGYTVGMTGYYYINGVHSNALETKVGLTYGPFAFSAQTLLNDVVWGNAGDTYWSAVFTQPLPYNLTFTGTLGAYTYRKEGKFLGTRDTAFNVNCAANEAFVVNGCFVGSRPVGSAFRYVALTLSGPIPETPLTWSLTAIIGGDNRFGVKQDSRMAGSLSWVF